MLKQLLTNILNRSKKMSLLDDDLTEKLDIPMIFEAIEVLKETMNKNLEEIAIHEKAISILHKNVSAARSELGNVKALLDQIVNPKPKYDDTELQNSELQKLIEGFTTSPTSNGLWWYPSNYPNGYSTTAGITTNGVYSINGIKYSTFNDYDDTKTITGI